MRQIYVEDFDSWRSQSRCLISSNISPDELVWESEDQPSFFEDEKLQDKDNVNFNVPKEFISLAKAASCHRNQEKWSLLYRILWRLIFEEKNLLRIHTDNDVFQLNLMRKQVARDAHKMKAFVRFREVGENEYVAWHEPEHLIVQHIAAFFVRRFNAMKWTILTPDESAIWDGDKLCFSEGVPRSKAPNADEMEEMWKTFYKNIFNPARIKVKMMKSEMPTKYWHTMPETALINEMLEGADKRVKKMIEDNA